jgi:uncharacterized protein
MVELMRRGREAADIMAVLAHEEAPFTDALNRAGRNDPCPCGSGAKVKRCHGRPTAPTRLPEWQDDPRAPVTTRGKEARRRAQERLDAS